MIPSFMKRIEDRLADRREDRHDRREAVAVDREPAQRVVRDPDVLAVVLSTVGSFGSMMKAPEQPAADLVGGVVVGVVHHRARRLGHELVGERLARARSASGSRTARRP